MIPELGHFSLIVALCLAMVLGVLPILGAARNNAVLMGVARPVAYGQLLFVGLSFAALAYAFLNNDFSVLYVAQHSNSQLPAIYRFSAIWGGHEGSLLLWALFLSVWTAAVALFSRHLPEEMVARVLGVMGLIAVGFMLFMLFTSSPFERLLPAAADGRDLNPLLQDPGLVIHPPMLYMGYVGFSVAYAFAISALLGGKLDATWARWSRPWTTVAWVFMTLGIALGSGWAYYELGWGGWWFWDPVENASFMPWLLGTALIHSLAVTEKRGAFKSWTVLLAIAAFSLSLLGTFLVRSGVLTSVHSFAADPKRGIFILTFLVLVVGASLLLFAWRAPKVGLGGKFDLISRESLLLSNNVLLSVASASVFIGTLYPLFMDALGYGKLSVGAPYFEAVFVPLMIPMVLLMGLGPLARWKKMEVPELAKRVQWGFASALVLALLLPLLMGKFLMLEANKWSPMIVVGLLMAFWIIASLVISLRQRWAGQGAFMARVRKQSRSYYGMQLAHLGVAFFIIGVTLVKGYETERDVRMNVGDTVMAGGYEFKFNGVTETEGPNYVAGMGHVVVSQDGKRVGELNPEKRQYNVSGMPLTEAAIQTGLFRDLYVSLGEAIPESEGAWAVRVYIKPFVDWIWAGCLLMGLGGLFAVSDRRYRIHKQAVKQGQPS
ncbi:MAG: c-type cytochrome biogenesis protein CcmF [Gallionellales bacterium CG_4_10_14_3_um_filter_54_96]|nr:MAG: c-type cytochrome biogenesis protein CcmF [Gallionellales bacterium CG03_land_8_20_14_0_80_55_15]PIX04184.1 MAG: c-type cytochrome biogenesis protein CcmF [Gallionellales bacterium CG_4_8_14_3_um_filter_54_18]PIY03628.1 MAG: c-type cytochrome biogenesis protein CcmF [Gallionellales bacterium CG_4_10_14_3_um_filter_54_96]PJC05071.1 MAG: c-type cytochrome biogenesis protein CcmF [Gallionellales bacterium CG_4_9_14_0_8_um_filter_55_61]